MQMFPLLHGDGAVDTADIAFHPWIDDVFDAVELRFAHQKSIFAFHADLPVISSGV